MDSSLFSSAIQASWIHLNDNKITSISKSLFSNTKQITSIFLHNNALTHIDSRCFSGLQNLSDLRLSGNAFVTPVPVNEIKNSANPGVRIGV